MRTLDPETWSKKLRKPPLKLSRPMRFGRRPRVESESRARRSFYDAMREYDGNHSVQGVRYLYDGSKLACMRYFYSTILLVLLCFGLYTVIGGAYSATTRESTMVKQRDGLYSIKDVPFPAVAFCSNNVISRRALMQYTMSLVTKRRHNKTYSAAMIAQNLAQLGHLLSMTMPQEHVDMNFMGYLTSIDPRARVSSLMYRFAPKCSSMLLRCSWRGETLPCEELLQTRVTPLGYCCVFNSRYEPEDAYKLPRFLDMVGEDYGLSVVMKQDFGDFSFYRRPSHDIDVLIFDGNDYPLLEGGGARMYPVEGNASVYLTLTAKVHYPEGGFHHDIESRRCRARRARGPLAGRSHAWCLAECRRHTLAALCDCRLHTLLPAPFDWLKHTDQCSLTHLACLNKQQEKFMYYHYPGAGGAIPLDQELRNAQDCSHCAPDCARVAYSATVAVSRRVQYKLLGDPLLEGLPLDNITTFKLFYASKQLKSYEFQENSRWYESFVKYGSEWSLIVGASVVSASELVFHGILRWRHHYHARTRPPNHPT